MGLPGRRRVALLREAARQATGLASFSRGHLRPKQTWRDSRASLVDSFCAGRPDALGGFIQRGRHGSLRPVRPFLDTLALEHAGISSRRGYSDEKEPTSGRKSSRDSIAYNTFAARFGRVQVEHEETRKKGRFDGEPVLPPGLRLQ
jgi:hypothetical protein